MPAIVDCTADPVMGELAHRATARGGAVTIARCSLCQNLGEAIPGFAQITDGAGRTRSGVARHESVRLRPTGSLRDRLESEGEPAEGGGASHAGATPAFATDPGRPRESPAASTAP